MKPPKGTSLLKGGKGGGGEGFAVQFPASPSWPLSHFKTPEEQSKHFF